MLGRFHLRIVLEYLPLFFQGLAVTLGLSALSLGGAFLVGVLGGLARLSHRFLVRAPVAAYVAFIRATPLLAQVYFIYFGLPSAGIYLTAYQTGVLSLVVNSGAYMTEIIRAGIESIPRGQTEAAASLGLTAAQRMRYVILPQAVAKVTPPLIGQGITLVKDSALLSLIAVAELTRSGQVMLSERFLATEAFFTVAALYLALYGALSGVARLVAGRVEAV